MSRHSTNLRQAFAANPTRFLAVATPRAATHRRTGTEIRATGRLRLASRAFPAEAPLLPDRLRRLGLHGMALALVRLDADPAETTASPGAFLSLFVDAEIRDRKERRISRKVRAAGLRYPASTADLDYGAARGLDEALFHLLALGQWIADRENAIVEGPPGVGKTWLACALGERACRDDRSVRYERTPRLLADLSAMRGTGRHARRMRSLGRAELLILDDWAMEPFGAEQRHDMLELLDERYGRGSTLIASPLPVERWPAAIGDAVVAAAILDRIVPNAHRLRLVGDSLRDRSGVGGSV
jgi:DNA replication protein DnaC